MNICILATVLLFAVYVFLAHKKLKTLRAQIAENNLEIHELNEAVYGHQRGSDVH